MQIKPNSKIVTITLNPAIDRTLYLEKFCAGQVNRIDNERLDFGGKGINVAKVIHSLQQPVAVAGFLGRNNAAQFNQYFADKSIENHFEEIPGETRVNIKIVDRNDVVTELNSPGFTPQIADLEQLESKLCQLAVHHKLFVLSGSLPQNVPTDTYAKLINVLHDFDCKVILDTSGPALAAGIEARPFAIKPNLPELMALFRTPLDCNAQVIAIIRKLLSKGITMVAVSLGVEGALVANTEQVISVRPPVVTVKSTVGAGDAFVAGFAVGLFQNMSMVESSRLATAAAAASVALPGTQAATLAETDGLLAKVQVKMLS